MKKKPRPTGVKVPKNFDGPKLAQKLGLEQIEFERKYYMWRGNLICIDGSQLDKSYLDDCVK